MSRRGYLNDVTIVMPPTPLSSSLLGKLKRHFGVATPLLGFTFGGKWTLDVEPFSCMPSPIQACQEKGLLWDRSPALVGIDWKIDQGLPS